MNTGICRRIDDLGRISIPRHIRSQLQIDDGDPMEISISNRSIILTPYTPLKETKIIDTLLKVLNKHSDITVVVTSKNEVISSMTKEIPRYTSISSEIQALIYKMEKYYSNGTDNIRIINNSDKIVIALFPIKKVTELYGSLTLVGDLCDIPSDINIMKGQLLADIISEAISEI